MKREKFILNIILPSGDTVPFETGQTFYEQYMEAFSIGGEYQWQVVARSKDGNDICISDAAKFDKPAYNPPKNGDNGGSNNSDSDGKNGSNNGGGGEPPPPPNPPAQPGT